MSQEQTIRRIEKLAALRSEEFSYIQKDMRQIMNFMKQLYWRMAQKKCEWQEESWGFASLVNLAS
ncbi:hypothetical protein AAHB53_02295 [Niallia circulans]